MSWPDYLTRISGGDQQKDIATAARVSGPTVSRWMAGDQGVDPATAAAVARHYGRPVLEAFVAAGYLTEKEARGRFVSPDITQLSDDELLAEVRRRMKREDEEHVQSRSPATSPAPGSGARTARKVNSRKAPRRPE